MTHERFDEIVSAMMDRWSEGPSESNPNNNTRNRCERMLTTALYEIGRDIERALEPEGPQELCPKCGSVDWTLSVSLAEEAKYHCTECDIEWAVPFWNDNRNPSRRR